MGVKKGKTSKVIVDGKLTEQQRNFAIAYTLVTDFDALEAVDAAGYKYESASEKDNLSNKRKMARSLLNNPKIKEYIATLVEERDNQTIIDKTFVKNGLKKLAISANNENTQVKAYELLGKELGMFVNKEEISISDDPGEIAKKAFESRILKLHKKEEIEVEDESTIS
jgi:phage terminase small subunit